jgi:hypothetical protein
VSDDSPEFGLNVVSPRHCVACNACHARFRRVGATCRSCGADHALVGVTILPLTASDTLFDPESTALNDRRAGRRLRFAFWRRGRRSIPD